jgi:hypothetical protein
VRTSTILEQADNYAVVEQKAVAKFLMFSKRIHLVLEVHQTPGIFAFATGAATASRAMRDVGR